MVVIVVEVVVVVVVVMALIMAAALAVVVSGMLALRTSELSSQSSLAMTSMISFETALDNREGIAGAVLRRERSSATITGGSVLDSIE